MKQIILLYCLTISFVVAAQQIDYSGVPKHNYSGFNKVIGENEDGIFVLNHKNNSLSNDFYMERFNHNLNKSVIHKIIIPKASIEKMVIQEDKFAYILSEGKKYKGVKNIRLESRNSYDFMLADASDIDFEEYDFSKETFPIYVSKEKQFTMAVPCVEGKNAKIHFVSSTNNKLKQIGTFNTEYDNNKLELYDLVQDPAGNIYLLASVNEKGTTIDRFVLFIYDVIKNTTQEITLNNSTTYFTSPKILLDRKNKRVNVVSLYGSYFNENEGYSIVSYSTTDFKRELAVFNVFDSEIVKGIIGVRGQEKGQTLNNFYLKEVKAKEDGGLIIIAEKFVKQNQQETQFINGTPQIVTRSVYNYDEVILLSTNANGELEWDKKINKKQTTMYDGGFFSSIQVIFTDYEVHILYNDMLNNNGGVIQYTCDILGNERDKLILDSKTYYQLLVPIQGSQIGYNRAVIPAEVNKTMKLIKLTY